MTTAADAAAATAIATWRPPPVLSLSEWADEYYVLSSESAAEPGRWKTLPYQKGIMDAITDPTVSDVTLIKSSRVGYTLCVTAAIGYHIHQDPTTILVVQPTVDDAKAFSKESIAPLLRDVPVLAAIRVKDMSERGPKDGSNTLQLKAFPGGLLHVIGANSGAGFRRVSRRIVILDEIDAYPASAGSEGDPLRLAMTRSQAFWNRKTICGSTPLVAGRSRIERRFLEGDQRRYYVPCPQCGHMDYLAFRLNQKSDDTAKGHRMAWPRGRPGDAYFVCSKNGCVMEHRHKREMIEGGEWRSSAPFDGHASFHVWSAYSYSPGATWGQIAKEFVAANKDGPEALRVFVGTVLGEPWIDRGEAPDWERLYRRREQYSTVPPDTLYLTAGVDVQRNRLVYEVVAWQSDKSSYSMEQGSIYGDTATPEPWCGLDELLARVWLASDGRQYPIRMMAVDSGDQTQTVYGWCRRHPIRRVIAIKGRASLNVLIGKPGKVDVDIAGRSSARGYRVFPVGVSLAKTELYGWLHLDPPLQPDQPSPPGYCHFPDSYPEEFFRELTAEQLLPTKKKGGYIVHEWALLPNRENHALDARIYARAAAALCRLDLQSNKDPPRPPPISDGQVVQADRTRAVASPAPSHSVTPQPIPPTQPVQRPPPARPRVAPAASGWVSGGGRHGY